MKKKKYQTPELSLVQLLETDIVRVSDGDDAIDDPYESDFWG